MSGDGQQYDVGGTFGSGLTAADGACAQQCICDSLDSGLAAITDALTAIDNTLADTMQQGCSIVNECQAEIDTIFQNLLADALLPIEEAQAFIQGVLAEQQVALQQLADEFSAFSAGEAGLLGIITEEPPATSLISRMVRLYWRRDNSNGLWRSSTRTNISTSCRGRR